VLLSAFFSIADRQNAGFARRLDDELPLLAKNIQQVNISNENLP